jgi:hypothetical protein
MLYVLSDQQAELGHNQPRLFVRRGRREQAKVPNLVFQPSIVHSTTLIKANRTFYRERIVLHRPGTMPVLRFW